MLWAFAGAGAVGAVLTVVFSDVRVWWLPLLQFGYTAGLLILFLLTSWAAANLIPPVEQGKPGREITRRWLWFLSSVGLGVCGIKPVITGTEKLPKEPFLLVCNHLSHFDPIICLAKFRKSKLIFISKPSNFRAFIAGKLIASGGFLSIDRDNPRNAIHTINQAAALLEEGKCSVGIYPEGHISKQVRMLPFKDGAFHIAKKCHAPLVVMTMQGGEEILHRVVFRVTKIKVDILDVISTEEIHSTRIPELSARVRKTMLANLDEKYHPIDEETEKV